MKTLGRFLPKVPLLLATAAFACSPSGSSKADEGPELVFSEHKFLKADRPTKEIGEACDTYGASECKSGLCVHAINPASDRGHVCTMLCSSHRDCPGDWMCAPITNSLLCLPGIERGER